MGKGVSFRWFAFPLLRLFAWVALTVLGPFRVRGARRVPRSGALIVLANHLSDADPVALQAACPRPLIAMADHELFDETYVGKTLRFMNAIPVKRGTPDRAAIRAAAEALKAGEALCVYPEGQISESGELMPLMPGVALLHRMTGATLICARLVNTNRIRPYRNPESELPKVTKRSGKWVEVHWGEACTFPEGTAPEEILEWIRQELSGRP